MIFLMLTTGGVRQRHPGLFLRDDKIPSLSIWNVEPSFVENH